MKTPLALLPEQLDDPTETSRVKPSEVNRKAVPTGEAKADCPSEFQVGDLNESFDLWRKQESHKLENGVHYQRRLRTEWENI
jgi:hypothetical protein